MMSYEYKDTIQYSIIHYYDHVLLYNEYTDDVLEELDHVYAQAAKADENEAKNKELLEELQYLRKVNDDLVWQRDTDEEHEAKAKAFDRICEAMDYHYPSESDRKYLNGYQHPKASLKDIDAIINKYESGESDD